MTKTEAAVLDGEVHTDTDDKPTTTKAVATRTRRAPTNVQVPAPIDPVAIYQMAIEKGDIQIVNSAYDFAMKVEANNAKKAYAAAIAACRPQLPVIIKNARVAYDAKQSNGKVDYAHETLAQISEQIDEILGEHGLSYRFKIEQTMPANSTMLVHVTCLVSHSMGHEEPTTLFAAIDIGAGKNHIQAIGSAVTYLQRYTLKAALGLSAAETDTDGRDVPDPQKPKPSVPRASQSGGGGGSTASTSTSAPDRKPQPHKLAPVKNETFTSWSLRYIAAIKASDTLSELTAWDKANDVLLDEMYNHKDGRAVYDEINRAFQNHKATLLSKGNPPQQRRDDPISSGPSQPAEKPASKWSPPDHEKDYESFLSWAADKLRSWIAEMGDLEEFWNDVIEPAMIGAFPSDKDDLMSEYRKAEHRLGG